MLGPAYLLWRQRRLGFSEGPHFLKDRFPLQPQNPWIFQLFRSRFFCWLFRGLSPLSPVLSLDT